MTFTIERRRDPLIQPPTDLRPDLRSELGPDLDSGPRPDGDGVDASIGDATDSARTELGRAPTCAAAEYGAPGAIGAPCAPGREGAPPPREDLGIGARRRAGIQSLAADSVGAVGDLPVTRALLSRSLEETGNGADQQLRFRIGDETLTAGQLRLAVDQDPSRFRDFLANHGISVAEFNEMLDDVVDGEVAPGTVIDLREGSETARAYRMGGADGVIVDSHLDRGATETAAADEPTLTERQGLRGERVEGPGFFEAIGEALAEAAGWIARLFGSSWNPDTVTFNGRVDDAHFRNLGRAAATGDRGLALQAVLGAPGGEDRLRQELQAQKPSSATDTQWNRAIDRYLEGARTAIRSETRVGRLPEAVTGRDAENVALYLHAHGFSADAQREVRLVLAQPAAIRGRALELLNSLPQTERDRMLQLFSPPIETSDDENLDEATQDAQLHLWGVQDRYSRGSLEEKMALFETLANDGFRTPLDAGTTYRAALALQSDSLPDTMTADLRSRYFALLPRVGLDRSGLLGGNEGLLSQLRDATPAEQRQLLDDFEARIGSTHDLERLLGADGTRMHLTGARAGIITSPVGKRQVVDTFETQNLRLRFTPTDGTAPLVISARGAREGEVSLERYFADATYRNDVLRRTGMDRAAFEGMLQNLNTSIRTRTDESTVAFLEDQRAQLRQNLLSPTTTATQRAEITARLQEIETQLETAHAPMNVEVDISRGSRLHELFDLTGGGGPRHAQLQLSADNVRTGGYDFSIRLRAPGRGGRTGPEYTITTREMSELLDAHRDLASARAAFNERYPGLDFDETIRGFSAIHQLAFQGHLPQPADGSSPVLDFRRAQRDRALEGVRRTMTDGVANNTRGGDHSFRLGARTTGESTPVDHLGSDSRLGGAASNQWFQYGVFNARGYIGSREAEGRARTAFNAGGQRQDPGLVLDALFGMDGYRRTSELRTGGRTHEDGLAYGHTDDFLVDPRTGARAEGRDVQVLTFSGRGTSSDEASFRTSSARVASMFRNYGGVPATQIENHHEPSPDRMYRAIEGELMNDPRAAGDRARPRTVVVHFAGHTGSEGVGRDREVAGMLLTDGQGHRTFFTAAQVQELDRRAREQGVNLVWVVDACRAGEFVDQARSLDIAAQDAAGTLSPDVQHLSGLREALIEEHVMLTYLHEMRPHAPMPNDTTLARMGSAAVRGGPGSPALTALEARRDQVVAHYGAESNEGVLMTRYVAAVESQIEHRAALQASGDFASIVDDGIVSGATQWRSGRGFMTFTSGPLENKITEALRERLEAPPVVPRETRRPGVPGVP